MKDEINESVYGGGTRRLARGIEASVQQAPGGARVRTIPQRRRSLAPLRACGSKAAANERYNLWNVYEVISRWPACDRSPAEQYAYELALNRLLIRIDKSGPNAVVFESLCKVFAYAERIRDTSNIDASRHMQIKQRVLKAMRDRHGYCVNGLPSGYAPLEVAPAADWEQGLREETDWLHARLDADSAKLVQSVYIDDVSVAEIARKSKLPESTIRSRLGRAMDILRVSTEAEAVDRVRSNNN